MEKSQKGSANLFFIAVIIVLVGVVGYLGLVKKTSPTSINEYASDVEAENTVGTKNSLVFPEEGDTLSEGATYMVTIPGAESGIDFYLHNESAGDIRIADTYQDLSPWTVPSVLDYMNGGDSYHEKVPEDGYRIQYFSNDGSTKYSPTFKIISKKINTETSVESKIVSSSKENISTRTAVQIAEDNSWRVAQLANIRTSLILYSDDHTTYPVPAGVTAQERWASLGKALVDSKILSRWVQDPNQQNGFSYDYRTSPDNKSFVLKADMELDDAESLKIYDPRKWSKDHMNQGVIFGMDCTGPAFCDFIFKGSDNGFQ